MRALLDVNVLIALLDASHADHERARAWLTGEIRHGWASCALTQNGFVRIVSQPRYSNPVTTTEAMRTLARATQTEHHAYWPCSISLIDPRHVDPSRVYGAKQITDVYLLALAVEHGGRLVTFEQGIPLSAVPGAKPEHMVKL